MGLGLGFGFGFCIKQWIGSSCAQVFNVFAACLGFVLVLGICRLG